MSASFKKLLPAAPLAVAAIFALTASPKKAVADEATVDVAEKNEKCATRVYTALIGEGAPATANAAPQAAVDALLEDPKFQDRFARFANAQMNTQPGAIPAEDASYYLARHVLQNDKPWSDMFVGKYDVAPQNAQQMNGEAVVTDNPNGLGYFRSRAWAVRYAGNELAGMRIVMAYRMMQNTVGLTLTATTNAPDVDLSASGRKGAQCAGCHFDNWYALDKVASVLGTVKRQGMNVTFDPPTGGPQSILGGVMIKDDAELAQALVSNEAFDVNACRLSFKYLYGRQETSCEGPIFDSCVAAFKKDKKITSALAVVAKDPSFCE